MLRCLSHRRWICTSTAGSMSGRVVNEFRHNLVTDDWVVFSSARRGRPRQVQPVVDRCNLTSLPSHDATCPFCLGNEHETPEATLTVNYPGTDKWRLRVVPNKFPVVTDSVVSCDPAVSRGGGARREGALAIGTRKHSLAGHEGEEESSRRPTATGASDLSADLKASSKLVDGDDYDVVDSVPAMGFHEVLIETPEHNLPTALMAPPQVEAIVQALQQRGRAMQASDATLRHIMYFKNSGAKAGASLLHPHSQIVALPIVPVEVAQRQRHARQWFIRYQKSIFEHTLDTTLKQRDEARRVGGGGSHRVVLEDEHFVCFIPFAALSPYTLWIVPKGSGAHFHEAPEPEMRSFARTLHQALRCLHFGLDQPDFNLVIRSAALEVGAMSVFRPEVYFRWYCTIIPRLGVGGMGGFEFSTGIQSNSSFPEDDAAFLRSLNEP